MSQELKSTIVPFMRYADAPKTIEWLVRVFGFEKQLVVPGPADTIAHAQLTFGGSTIMVGSVAKDDFGMKTPSEAGGVTQGIYVIVENVDAHFQQAKDGGAEIVRELADTAYGSREYMARDVEGHLWSFGTYDPGGQDEAE